jgi:hypothetical protein
MTLIRKLSSIALVAVAAILVTASLSYAAPHGGHGLPGRLPVPHVLPVPHGAPVPHFDGHRAFGHGFDGGRHFVRGPHVGLFVGVPLFVPPAYPAYYPPAYTYEPPAPSYWYYCPSYGAYYPNAPSCPEPWVPVPAQ